MGEIECNVEKRVVKTVFYEVENKPKFHLMKKIKKVQLLSQRRISCSKIYVFFLSSRLYFPSPVNGAFLNAAAV